MFENVGGGEILLILLVILIFFGPKKIPELAQSLGKGIRKFNDAKAGIETQVKTAMKEPLEALTGAKDGFEQSLRTAAAPLHAELNLPQNLIPQAPQPVAPAQPIAPETQPRIPETSAVTPETPTTTPAPLASTPATSAATPTAIPERSVTPIPDREA